MPEIVNFGGKKRIDVLGKRYGMLLVIEKAPSNKIETRFVCLCDCGVSKIISGVELKRGQYKSCGCNRTPQKTKMYREHPLYNVWKGIKARCNDKNHIAYKNYGGSGVSVCAEWDKNFVSFYNWAIQNGYKKGLQVDKDIIPNKKGEKGLLYSPETCLLVDAKSNRRASKVVKLSIEIVDKIKKSNLSNSKLAKTYNVNPSTIYKIKKNKIWK